jgi:hypothetical protein
MKASSESGECANLISVALTVAGFVGIAFCVLSLLAFCQRQCGARGVTPARSIDRHTGATGRTAQHPHHREDDLGRIPLPRKPHFLSAEGYHTRRWGTIAMLQPRIVRAAPIWVTRPLPCEPLPCQKKPFRQDKAASTNPAIHESVPTIRNRDRSGPRRAGRPRGRSSARW